MLNDVEKSLWAIAAQQRVNMKIAETNNVVPSLIFIKYASDTIGIACAS